LEKLKVVDAETLLNSPLAQVNYIVDEILPIGLHLFCGAPKVGKSWFMLKLCLQVSKGEDFWNFKTNKCDVLYMCLEDTYARLQNRLFKLTDVANKELRFATFTNGLANGLIQQLEDFLQDYPQTKLIVIDTLQKIRKASNDISYAGDYGDVSILKQLADKYKIAIILVHHIRKQGDSDVFNKVSGTTGIMGSADTTFVLEKRNRSDCNATLYVTGRDIEYQEFTLRLDNCSWELVSRASQQEIEIRETPDVIFKVMEYIDGKGSFKGSATELLEEIKVTNIAPNIITKLLNEYRLGILKENNISYDYVREHNGRCIVLKKRDSCDSCVS